MNDHRYFRLYGNNYVMSFHAAGQGLLSLEVLDKKCEHRVTVDLVDEKGRKPTGGKLTVVARLREPLTGLHVMHGKCMYMWQSHVENENYSYLILTTFIEFTP